MRYHLGFIKYRIGYIKLEIVANTNLIEIKSSLLRVLVKRTITLIFFNENVKNIKKNGKESMNC